MYSRCDYLLFVNFLILLSLLHSSNFQLFLYLFKATRTLSRKTKICPKPPYNRAGCIVEPYNASRQPKFQFCQKLVKVVTFMCAWAETLQTHGFPVQTYGETSKGHNFKCKTWIKFSKGQISAFDPFCTLVQKLCPQVLPVPHWINY